MDKKLIENIQYTFNTPEGKEVLEFLYQFTGIDIINCPTCQLGKDSSRTLSPMELAYNEGMRAVGLQIKQLMNEDLNNDRTRTNIPTRTKPDFARRK